jgi:hypothetical protein
MLPVRRDQRDQEKHGFVFSGLSGLADLADLAVTRDIGAL